MESPNGDRRRAVALNAAGQTLAAAGRFLPLSERRRVADAVLDAVDGLADPARRRIPDLAQVLADLDRCVHGRHEQDPCYTCPGGVSTGNPHLRTGMVIGYDVGGAPIVMPDRGRRHDPAAWRTITDRL